MRLLNLYIKCKIFKFTSVAGPYFVSFTIKNLHNQQIFLQTNFEQFPRIEPGKVLTRYYKRTKADPLTFMVYDAVSLEPLTLNGKPMISLIPTTERKDSIVLSVPYNG